MWLDPLVERRHLKNINVTTNLFNIRMEVLKEKFAADNKQVLFLYICIVVTKYKVCRERMGKGGRVDGLKFSPAISLLFFLCAFCYGKALRNVTKTFSFLFLSHHFSDSYSRLPITQTFKEN